MRELYKKALESYIEMLEIHIDTKTEDLLFHRETEVFYDNLFKVAHQIGERYVDLDGKINPSISLEEKKKKANQIISDLLKEIENYKDNNQISTWTDDLLWGLADELEDIKWTSKWFLN